MFRYGIFLVSLACVDGKFSPDFFEPETDPLQEDLDGDGYAPIDGDCDDNNAQVFPSAVDHCDGIDNNCNEEIDEQSIHFVWKDGSVSWKIDSSVETVMVEIDTEDWLGEPFADGMIDSSIQYSYVEGRLIEERRLKGNQEILIRYLYNEAGWKLEEQWTSSAWGRNIRYGYDSTGLLLRVDIDEGADGSVDKQQVYQYENNILVERTDFVDGVREASQKWVYEGDRLLSLQVHDFDKVVSYQYEGDIADGFQTVLVDVDEDGIIDEQYSQWFDEHGRMVKEGREMNGIEGFEQISSWTYANKGFVDRTRSEPSLDNEEYIVLEEEDAHHFRKVHDIDSSFWEQNHVEQISLTCVRHDPKVEE